MTVETHRNFFQSVCVQRDAGISGRPRRKDVADDCAKADVALAVKEHGEGEGTGIVAVGIHVSVKNENGGHWWLRFKWGLASFLGKHILIETDKIHWSLFAETRSIM